MRDSKPMVVSFRNIKAEATSEARFFGSDDHRPVGGIPAFGLNRIKSSDTHALIIVSLVEV